MATAARASDAPSAEPADAEPVIDPKHETTVVATTPLHGSLLPSDRVAANVQTATGKAIDGSHDLDITQFMNETLGSVTTNQVQENPLQPDFQYRGFTASPVLGASEGVSVFLNGVRLNEPFGDIVNWDLIPPGAIRSLNLMPGSNPLFGLNTLGGALSMETKTGFSDPGTEAEVWGGSFGRAVLEVQAGEHGEHWGYFGVGRFFREDGWREHSSSQALNGFLSASYRNGGSTLDLSLMGAGTSMTGLGAAPVELLAQDRNAVFTYPDETHNRLLMAMLRGDQSLTLTSRLSATAYFRISRTLTTNGDQGQWAPCTAPGQTANVCADDGTTVILDPSGNPVPFDPNNTYDASDNTTATRQLGFGGSVQGSFEAPLARHENHLFVGGSVDEGQFRFRSQTVLAQLNDTRGAVDTDFVDPTSRVAVDGTVTTLGVFASDTFALLPDLFLTVSGRFNYSAQALQDQLGGALSGDNHFHRLNPAVGLSYQPRPEIGLYGSYGESARAPTPMELTCASPTDPCRLPNEFVADPPLAQVVARTFEAGVRGRLDAGAPSSTTRSRRSTPPTATTSCSSARVRSRTRATSRTSATPSGRGSRPGSVAGSASAGAGAAWSGRPTTRISTPPFRHRSSRRAPTTRWRSTVKSTSPPARTSLDPGPGRQGLDHLDRPLRAGARRHRHREQRSILSRRRGEPLAAAPGLRPRQSARRLHLRPLDLRLRPGRQRLRRRLRELRRPRQRDVHLPRLRGSPVPGTR